MAWDEHGQVCNIWGHIRQILSIAIYNGFIYTTQSDGLVLKWNETVEPITIYAYPDVGRTVHMTGFHDRKRGLKPCLLVDGEYLFIYNWRSQSFMMDKTETFKLTSFNMEVVQSKTVVWNGALFRPQLGRIIQLTGN